MTKCEVIDLTVSDSGSDSDFIQAACHIPHRFQWRIQDFEKGGSSVHVTDRIKRAKRALGVCGKGGTCPSGKFLISDLLRSLLVPFWA